MLDEMQPTYGFDVEEVDITADADLLTRYRYEIPVLLRDGHEIARGRITERDLVTLVAVK